MKDKVVVITGSSSGIGASAAQAFAKLGAQLVLHGTDATRLSNIVDVCVQLSPTDSKKPVAVIADFSIDQEIERIRDGIQGNRVDVLVNNVVHLTTLLLPMMQHKGANIVNISSSLTLRPNSGTSAYVCSKAALEAYTKSLAIDLAPNVRVNSISPGPIATMLQEKHGLDVHVYRETVNKDCLVERVGEVEEVTRVILFLASTESEFITGTNILIDGGSSIKPNFKIMNLK